MMDRATYHRWQQRTLSFFRERDLALSESEQDQIEVADFGLGRLEEFGLELVVYVNTDGYCAKELVMFSRQICPEHRHPPRGQRRGKEETFRCRWGEVFLYTPGPAAKSARAAVPEDKVGTFTVWHETILHPGDQFTIAPNTLHWFQAGADGAWISEFSDHSDDGSDIFTDTAIRRVPNRVEE
jgi:D-lyxose ketol-isomerase